MWTPLPRNIGLARSIAAGRCSRSKARASNNNVMFFKPKSSWLSRTQGPERSASAQCGQSGIRSGALQ